MRFDFTEYDLQKALPKMKDTHTWYDLIMDILPKYDIDTPERVAMFLAQCGHESRDFNVLEENLNYSYRQLLKVFDKYFNSSTAKAYARQPEKIANIVYANRMDNGPTESGDGWRHRGMGVIQLTGKYNQAGFAKSVGMSLDEVAEYLQTKEGALRAACWYWDMRDLNVGSDRGDIVGVTKRINGGTNGLADRKRRYNRAVKAIGNKSSVKTVDSKPSNYDGPYGMGSRGEGVKSVQRALGLYEDGIYGPVTKRTVKVWQMRKGLVADGIVGKNTAKSLGFI